MKIMICVGVLIATFALQANAGDVRIGVVDTGRILRESDQAIRAEKKIEHEFESRDQDIKNLIKQSKDLQAALDKDGSAMTDTVRRGKERELANMNINLQTLQREFREDLNLRKNEELSLVLAQADKAIREIAESEQYDIILQEAVYRNPRVDITDKVLKYLAKESPEKSDKPEKSDQPAK